MNQIVRWSSSRPVPLLAGGAMALDLGVSVLERVSGMPDTLWALHAVPVGAAAWFGGRGWGVAMALWSLLLRVRVVQAVLASPGGGEGAGELALRYALLVGAAVLVAAWRDAVSDGAAGAPRSDPSTGLANSRALFDAVTGEIERAQRYGRAFTLIYIGIDNVPAIQQRSGGGAAEEVLRRIAHQIRGSLRNIDVVARLRDREFAVLLPETGAEGAKIVLGRLQRGLTTALAEEPYSLSFALGATTWVDAEIAVEALHQGTYQLMYAARRDGAAAQHQVLEGGAAVEMPHRHLRLRE